MKRSHMLHGKALVTVAALLLLVIPFTVYAATDAVINGTEQSQVTTVLSSQGAESTDGDDFESDMIILSDTEQSVTSLLSSQMSLQESQAVVKDESGSIVVEDEDYVRVGIFIEGEAKSKYVIRSDTGFEYGYSDDVYFTKVGETDTSSVTIQSSGSNTVQIYDASGKFIYEFEEKNGSALAIRACGYATLTPTSPRKSSSVYYDYEGYFEFPRVSTSSGSAMRLINVVELETYVLCVLPCEIGSYAPIEAMKAQTLCIRSIVMSPDMNKKHDDCNICSDTDCQAYYGTYNLDITKEASVKRYNNLVSAVEDTKGEYLVYVGNDKYYGTIVQAAYHSNSGGSTVSAKSFWGVSNQPYNAAVRIPEEVDYYNWGAAVVKLEEIYAATKMSDFTESTTSWKKEIASLGMIASVEILELEKNSDHVIKLAIRDVNGKEVILDRGTYIYYFIHRVILNCETYYKDTQVTILSSTNFTWTPIDSSAVDLRLQTSEGSTVVPSDEPVTVVTADGEVTYEIPGETVVITSDGQEKVDLTVDAEGYKLVGKGWSHCVGMGQKTAETLADLGFKYDEILHRFFTDIEIFNMEDTGYEFSYDS